MFRGEPANSTKCGNRTPACAQRNLGVSKHLNTEYVKVLRCSDLAQTPPFSLRDLAWQTIYRLAFPFARRWWRLRGQNHQGALVAVWVDEALLLVRSSYRDEWNFPGGSVRHGETPEAAARRELMEEVGLAVSSLIPAGTIRGVWDDRPDEVHLFELRLAEPAGIAAGQQGNHWGATLGTGYLARHCGYRARQGLFGQDEIIRSPASQRVTLAR